MASGMLLLLVARLSTAVFFTDSKEKEYPRIGRRGEVFTTNAQFNFEKKSTNTFISKPNRFITRPNNLITRQEFDNYFTEQEPRKTNLEDKLLDMMIQIWDGDSKWRCGLV